MYIIPQFSLATAKNIARLMASEPIAENVTVWVEKKGTSKAVPPVERKPNREPPPITQWLEPLPSRPFTEVEWNQLIGQYAENHRLFPRGPVIR